jgi:3-hydroxyacyl-[acyl-carrier-protein] dehydratase
MRRWLLLEYGEIRKILPHGHPMVLVDRILRLEPGASILGIKTVSGTEPCYCDVDKDADPGLWAYPSSLLFESFGQTAAILWLSSGGSLKRTAEDLLMFVAGRNLEIVGRAFPGDVLRHEARIEKVVGNNVFVEGETWVEDRRIATIGSMIAVIRSRESVLGSPESVVACVAAPLAGEVQSSFALCR